MFPVEHAISMLEPGQDSVWGVGAAGSVSICKEQTRKMSDVTSKAKRSIECGQHHPDDIHHTSPLDKGEGMIHKNIEKQRWLVYIRHIHYMLL